MAGKALHGSPEGMITSHWTWGTTYNIHGSSLWPDFCYLKTPCPRRSLQYSTVQVAIARAASSAKGEACATLSWKMRCIVSTA